MEKGPFPDENQLNGNNSSPLVQNFGAPDGWPGWLDIAPETLYDRSQPE
jgi:hypothetical protein